MDRIRAKKQIQRNLKNQLTRDSILFETVIELAVKV
jgi:hypothetical protein